MLKTFYVTQPENQVNYLELFKIALGQATFKELDVAVAYATMRGVIDFESPFSSTGKNLLEQLQKRWLVGIDWCRSEPLALKRLSNLKNSHVKIPNGKQTVKRRGCTPKLPFHPKAFILRGPDALAIISGSGNMSRNGLTRGHECGSLLIFQEPLTQAEFAVRERILHVNKWFDGLWQNADALDTIVKSYSDMYEEASNMHSPMPTDDDATEADAPTRKRRGAISSMQLRQLRAARFLWIEFWENKTRGEDKPGDQLNMTRMTRVFFGYDAEVPKNAPSVIVPVIYKSKRYDRPLRFNSNGMDVLTLPLPEPGGPPPYDDEFLLFEKHPDGTFHLKFGTAAEARTWRRQSKRIDAYFEMKRDRRRPKRREWGIF